MPLMPVKLRLESEEQPLKASAPMYSTVSGTDTLVRLTHPLNVPASMSAALGRVMVVMFSFPARASAGSEAESAERLRSSSSGS